MLLERATEVGGTWRDNTYPGCRCDVPSHLYSFSFAPNPGWSSTFSPQPEILAYLEDCAERAGILPHVRFDTEVEHARWDDGEQHHEPVRRLGRVLVAIEFGAQARRRIRDREALELPAHARGHGPISP